MTNVVFAQTNAKKCKRATKPTHHDNTNRKEMNRREKALGHNRGLAKWGQKC